MSSPRGAGVCLAFFGQRDTTVTTLLNHVLLFKLGQCLVDACLGNIETLSNVNGADALIVIWLFKCNSINCLKVVLAGFCQRVVVLYVIVGHNSPPTTAWQSFSCKISCAMQRKYF